MRSRGPRQCQGARQPHAATSYGQILAVIWIWRRRLLRADITPLETQWEASFPLCPYSFEDLPVLREFAVKAAAQFRDFEAQRAAIATQAQRQVECVLVDTVRGARAVCQVKRQPQFDGAHFQNCDPVALRRCREGRKQNW